MLNILKSTGYILNNSVTIHPDSISDYLVRYILGKNAEYTVYSVFNELQNYGDFVYKNLNGIAKKWYVLASNLNITFDVQNRWQIININPYYKVNSTSDPNPLILQSEIVFRHLIPQRVLYYAINVDDSNYYSNQTYILTGTKTAEQYSLGHLNAVAHCYFYSQKQLGGYKYLYTVRKSETNYYHYNFVITIYPYATPLYAAGTLKLSEYIATDITQINGGEIPKLIAQYLGITNITRFDQLLFNTDLVTTSTFYTLRALEFVKDLIPFGNLLYGVMLYIDKQTGRIKSRNIDRRLFADGSSLDEHLGCKLINTDASAVMNGELPDVVKKYFNNAVYFYEDLDNTNNYTLLDGTTKTGKDWLKFLMPKSYKNVHFVYYYLDKNNKLHVASQYDARLKEIIDNAINTFSTRYYNFSKIEIRR